MRTVYLMTSEELAWGIKVIAFFAFILLFPSLSEALLAGLIVYLLNTLVSFIYNKFFASKIRTKQTSVVSTIIVVAISVLIIFVINNVIRTDGHQMEYFWIVLISGLVPMVEIIMMTPYPNPNVRNYSPSQKKSHGDSVIKPTIRVTAGSSKFLHCIKCGASATSESNFCTQCGVRLVD